MVTDSVTKGTDTESEIMSCPDLTCHLTNELSIGLCVELVVGFPPTSVALRVQH
jgi:hypothetical protein